MADPKPGVALLMTMPGIGPRTAEALVAYVDNAHRFSSVKKAGSYFGWDPCQDASGDKNRLGHITRNGPPTVRKLMVEAAWQGIRRSPTIRAFYERVTRNDPDRKKIAVVATAHHMTRVAVSMLKSGKVWKEDERLASDKPESPTPPVRGSAPEPPPRKPPSACGRSDSQDSGDYRAIDEGAFLVAGYATLPVSSAMRPSPSQMASRMPNTSAAKGVPMT